MPIPHTEPGDMELNLEKEYELADRDGIRRALIRRCAEVENELVSICVSNTSERFVTIELLQDTTISFPLTKGYATLPAGHRLVIKA